ncbi:hypothetical protein ACFV2X_38185 [Streptomyces sp. NPDC059679]|uniref:hypothetical protein n=1 Tax=Streptomyces sp. NPDC059679 TaxID=3346903 RepID=UPI003674CF1C
MTMPIVTATPGDLPDTFYNGKADAYDEIHAGATLPEMETRLDWLIDAATGPYWNYVAGYAAQVASFRMQTPLTIGAETELAYAHVEPNPEAIR